MKFVEWVEKRHPELLDESLWKKAAGAAVLAGALTAGLKTSSPTSPSRTSVTSPDAGDWDDDEDEDEDKPVRRMERHSRDLLAAAKRAGVPRSERNNLKGQKRGGVVVVVNGRKVPLTANEIEEVRAADQLRRSMQSSR